MKKYLALLLFALIASVSFGQSNYLDVVYLKNGSIIRGLIIEQVPNKSIKIETADRNVFVYQMDEVEKLTKELRTANMSSVADSKSPGLAWALSAVLPGGGQFYNGETSKGAIFLASYLVGWGVWLWSIEEDDDFLIAGLLVTLTSSIWSQIDATMGAIKINRASGGFATWNLGNGDAILAVQPDFNFTPISMGQRVSLTPTYGVGVKIKF